MMTKQLCKSSVYLALGLSFLSITSCSGTKNMTHQNQERYKLYLKTTNPTFGQHPLLCRREPRFF